MVFGPVAHSGQYRWPHHVCVARRYDATLQRWVTDKRVNARVWDDVPTMKPLAGSEYTIWPVIHTALVSKKLQTVECEEVSHSKHHACAWPLSDAASGTGAHTSAPSLGGNQAAASSWVSALRLTQCCALAGHDPVLRT